METLLRDLKLGVRLLLKQPAFTLAALAVLALGIGANTAMFSLVNAFLLKPLAIHSPEELVGCYSRDARQADSYRGFSYPDYAELRDHNGVFSSLMAHNMAMVGLAEDATTTRRVFADLVTANYFATFGVPLFRGRAFTMEEERPGSAIPVVIVSHAFWRRAGADPALVGRTLRINGRSFTVVGIAPPGFSGTTALVSSELYLPLGMYEALVNDFEGGARPLGRDNYALIVVGRLRSGITRQAADAELATTAPSGPGEAPRTVVVRPLSRLSISTSPSNDDGLRLPSLLLQSMASVVLLIASLNVANMMLARGAVRRREMAIRVALGAGRRSVLSQLFTESLLLAVLGGAGGLLVAYWSTTLLVRSLAHLAPIDLVYSAAPDLRVLAATMGFCILSTVLFGLGPAWTLTRPDVFADLKGKEQSTAGAGTFSRRNLLVIAQLALSLMLLTAAGLFLRSSLQSARVAPGLRVDHSLVVEVDPSLAGYDEARGRELYRGLVSRLRGVPGVESVDLAATVPFGMLSLGRAVQRASDAPPVSADSGAAAHKEGIVDTTFNIVGPEYFKTMDVALLRGRPFAESETTGKTSPVAILDKLAADALWPQGDAVGQHIRMISGGANQTAREAEVVGVVASVQQRILGTAWGPHVYVPFGQEYQSDMTLHLKTRVQGAAAEARLLEAVRREIHATDAGLPVLSARTLRDHLEGSFDLWLARTAARMFTIFGGVALLLAVIGLYGVRAYSVARRTREIGIRMAIGSSAADALGMVLKEGLKLTAIGLGAGLLLSLALGKVLAGMLYQVSGVDPLVFVGASALLAAASLLACYFPARKAARIEPMVALRYE